MSVRSRHTDGGDRARRLHEARMRAQREAEARARALKALRRLSARRKAPAGVPRPLRPFWRTGKGNGAPMAAVQDGLSTTKTAVAVANLPASVKDAASLGKVAAKRGLGSARRSNLGVPGILRRGGTALSGAAGLAMLPGQAHTAFKDLRAAVRSGTKKDWGKAGDSSLTLGRTTLMTAKQGLETADRIHTYRSTSRAVRMGFLSGAPGADGLAKKLGRDAGRAAVKGPLERGALWRRTNQRLLKAGETGLHAAQKGAVNAGLEAAERAASSPAAKVLGRFAPGVNVAMAAHDTYRAVQDLRDPKKSVGKKITSGVTALGSIASATNIPVVSQVGAAVSTASWLVGSFL